MNRRRILLSLIVALVLLLQAIPFPAMADSSRIVVTLGANLSNAQKTDMLRFFGVSESEVEIILITNQDERNQLASLIPLEKIGSKTFSCALVSPTQSGGIQVKTANMNYVSSNMIASTLCTSGVVNCDVLAAAPFNVSGTGALTGVMMAYETASGETLLPERKQLANEELVTTNNIAETIGRDEATIVVNDIKIRIIRDGVTEKAQVTMVVDEVVKTTEMAMQDRSKATGAPMPKTLNEKDRNALYEFGFKIGQMGYKYEDVQPTLERVTINAVTASGIEDPLMETFDPASWDTSVNSDSILVNTDDGALGDDSGINSTFDSVAEEAPAIAETISTSSITLTSYAEVKGGTSIINDSDMLALYGSTGYALAKMDGTPVTDAIYTKPNYYNGWFKARLANRDGWTNGVLAPDGSTVIPFGYGEIEILNENWGIGYTLIPATQDDYDFETLSDNNFYKIENVDIYWLPTATYMGSLGRENFQNARAYDTCLNILNRATGKVVTFDQNLNMLGEVSDVYSRDYVPSYTTISGNGQKGLQAPDGTEILAPSFRNVDTNVRDGHFIVYTNEKEGLVNLNGQMVVPAEYDDINYSAYTPTDKGYSYVNFGYVSVENNGMMGYYRVGAGESCPVAYSYPEMENYGVSALVEDANGACGILAADGMLTSLSAYSNASHLSHSAGTLYRTRNEDYDYGLIDWHGEELLPIAYNGISMSGSGKYILVDSGSKVPARIFEVNYTGFPEPDTSALPMAATGSTMEVATVEVNRMADVTITPYSTIPEASLITDTNLLSVYGSDGKGLMTLDGELITETKYNMPYYSRGWLVGKLSAGDPNKYLVWTTGVLGLDGKEAMPFTYGEVEILNENWGLGYNLVPTDGEEYDFKSWSDDSLYLIDTVDIYWLPTATYLGSIERETFAAARAFGEIINIEDRVTGNVGSFDQNLNLLGGVEDLYDDSYANLTHYSTFSENGQNGLLAPDGSVILPASFKYVNADVNDGYFTVSDGEKEGLVNLDGQLVVPVEYDDIKYSYYSPMHREDAYVNFGYVCVEKGGMIGYYSLNEGETCPVQYKKDQMENCGVSAIYTDDSGAEHLVAADGVVTSLASYSDVSPLQYSSGALYRTTNEKYQYGLIDWHGNEILPCAYNTIKLSGDGEYLTIHGEIKGFTSVYKVSYDGSAAAAPAMPEITAEPAMPAEEAPESAATESSGSFLDGLLGMLGGDKKEEPTAAPTAAPTQAPTAAPTAEPAAAPEAPEVSMVGTLLSSAQMLVQADFTGNSASVKLILEQAITAIGDSNPNASAVLNSAVMLIGTGAADAATVSLLIQSAIDMLG